MLLIDADAFSEQYGNYYAEQGTAEGFIGTVGELIAEAPAVDAEPVRHGYWAFGYCEKEQMQCTICSSCGEAAYWDTDYGQQQFRYCPYCGAYMKNGGVR